MFITYHYNCIVRIQHEVTFVITFVHSFDGCLTGTIVSFLHYSVTISNRQKQDILAVLNMKSSFSDHLKNETCSLEIFSRHSPTPESFFYACWSAKNISAHS